MPVSVAIRLGRPKGDIKNYLEKFSEVICDTKDPNGIPIRLARTAAICYKNQVLARMSQNDTGSSMSQAVSAGSLTAMAKAVLIPDDDPVITYKVERAGKTSFQIVVGHVSFSDYTGVPALRAASVGKTDRFSIESRGGFARFAQSIGVYHTSPGYDAYSMITENVFHIREYGTGSRSKETDSRFRKHLYPVGFRIYAGRGRSVPTSLIQELIAFAGRYAEKQDQVSEKSQRSRKPSLGDIREQKLAMEFVNELIYGRDPESAKRTSKLRSSIKNRIISLLGSGELGGGDLLGLMATSNRPDSIEDTGDLNVTEFQWIMNQLEEGITWDRVADASQWANMKARDGGSIYKWHPGVKPRNWFTTEDNQAYQSDIVAVVDAINDVFSDRYIQKNYFNKIR